MRNANVNYRIDERCNLFYCYRAIKSHFCFAFRPNSLLIPFNPLDASTTTHNFDEIKSKDANSMAFVWKTLLQLTSGADVAATAMAAQ